MGDGVRGEHPGVLDQRGMVGDALKDLFFSMAEMKRSLAKAGVSSPGKDEMCYIMMAHLSDTAMGNVLDL